MSCARTFVARVAAAATLAACATAPVDPFDRGEAALARRDLPDALSSFDCVPVGHARYPDARAKAMVVERDLRRCHEAVHEALRLRAEWRDHAALAALQRAHEAWPAMPGLDGLIAATEARCRELPPAAPTDQPAAQRAVVAQGVAVPATPAGEYASVPPTQVPPVAADVARGLADAEARLQRLDSDGALAALERLCASAPDDVRVRERIARLLCQRGLVSYGEGDEAAAIAAFERAVALAPGHEPARRLLQQAQADPR